MGLSYYSNWGSSTIQQQNPDMGCLYPELLYFHDSFSMEYNTCIDPIFEPSHHEDECNASMFSPASVNNYTSPQPNLINLLPPLPEIFPPPPDGLNHSYLSIDSSSSSFGCYPKRQKTFHDHQNPFSGQLFDTNYASLVPTLLPDLPPLEFLLPMLPPDYEHDFQPQTKNFGFINEDHPLTTTVVHETTTAVASASASGGAVNGKKGATEGSTLSAQSMAARLRRKKITEKTQELGKLIPGGHKMNTAEMFQAAYKYIKFLQAQLGILQLMPSIQENEEEFDGEEFQELVTSPLVQEKMYMAERCLVPRKLVENTIANDRHLESKPRLLKEIHQLIKDTG